MNIQKQTIMTLPFVAIALLFTAVVNADTRKDGDHWLLAKYDLNGDERITPHEITSKKLDLFKMMDNDADGGVTYDEYETMDAAKRQAVLQARFNKLDTDRDGNISEAEYSSYLGLFASIDSNGDGALTAEEVGGNAKPAYVTRCFMWFCLRTQQKD